MNKAWKILIIAGIIFLIVAVIWEFYQASTGGRSSFTISILEMGRDNLFSESLEEHLTTDSDYQQSSIVSSPN